MYKYTFGTSDFVDTLLVLANVGQLGGSRSWDKKEEYPHVPASVVMEKIVQLKKEDKMPTTVPELAAYMNVSPDQVSCTISYLLRKEKLIKVGKTTPPNNQKRTVYLFDIPEVTS